MACSYKMKDTAGAWQTITGKPAMMAALADGRLDHLLPAGVLKAMATPAAAPKPAAAPRPAPAPAPNTIFTEDAAAKARELLRRKLGQLNSGLDPEMLQAGITLAGYHIEKGARSFSAYAQAMLADLGDAVRPYLKEFLWDRRVVALAGLRGTGRPDGGPPRARRQPGRRARLLQPSPPAPLGSTIATP